MEQLYQHGAWSSRTQEVWRHSRDGGVHGPMMATVTGSRDQRKAARSFVGLGIQAGNDGCSHGGYADVRAWGKRR